jgi:hypothetical protein
MISKYGEVSLLYQMMEVGRRWGILMKCNCVCVRVNATANSGSPIKGGTNEIAAKLNKERTRSETST